MKYFLLKEQLYNMDAITLINKDTIKPGGIKFIFRYNDDLVVYFDNDEIRDTVFKNIINGFTNEEFKDVNYGN